MSKTTTMIFHAVRARQCMSGLLAATCLVMMASIFSTAASAYIGPSFLQIPGVNGGWQGAPYKNWVKVNAHYWKTTPLGNFARRQPSRTFYSGPTAPRQGASEMVIAIDKGHPALSQLMDRCVKRTSIPEVMYAESSELSRDAREVGARPADVPEYFEYHGISVAHDIEGVPAFIPPDQLSALLEGRSPSLVRTSQADVHAQKAR